MTTVGPYRLYGSKLVAACARAGVHCCDLTGESPWVKDMIDKHHAEAKRTGAKIVPSCGFDSIPAVRGCRDGHSDMYEYGTPYSYIVLLNSVRSLFVALLLVFLLLLLLLLYAT